MGGVTLIAGLVVNTVTVSLQVSPLPLRFRRDLRQVSGVPVACDEHSRVEADRWPQASS